MNPFKAVTRRTLALALLLIACPVLSFAGQFKITRVPDGDTINAVGHDIEIKVRLVGIDAPEVSHGKREPGQPFSSQVRLEL